MIEYHVDASAIEDPLIRHVALAIHHATCPIVGGCMGPITKTAAAYRLAVIALSAAEEWTAMQVEATGGRIINAAEAGP